MLVLIVSCGLASGQECRGDLGAADAYTVGRVRFNVRYFEPMDLAVKVGELYSAEEVTSSIDTVRQKLEDAEMQVSSSARGAPVLGARYVDACVQVLTGAQCAALGQTGRCVGVTFDDYEIRVGLSAVDSLSSMLPRSRFGTDYEGVPRVLRLLNPEGLLANDDRTGLAPGLSLKTDLLAAGRTLTNEPVGNGPISLLGSTFESHSLQHNFYEADSALDFGVTGLNRGKHDIVAHVEQVNAKRALGAGEETVTGTSLGGRAGFSSSVPMLQTIALQSVFELATYTVNYQASSQMGEKQSNSSLVADGKLHSFNTRTALWFRAGFPDAGPTYEELEIFTGLQKEFLVKPNQTIGLALTGSFGEIWNQAPVYAQYFAGNQNANFLFTGSDTLLNHAPAGPSVRSLGSNEGMRVGTQGAGTFAGLSGTVSFPIRKWSKPLIPDVSLDDDNPEATLKNVMKNAGITTARSFLQENLVEQGMSQSDAAAQAAKVIDGEAAPVVRYIADEANAYAFKPIVVFDYAHLSSARGAVDTGALGAGMEFAIVNFAVQGGYARTLHGVGVERAGNVFFALQFRNIF